MDYMAFLDEQAPNLLRLDLHGGNPIMHKDLPAVLEKMLPYSDRVRIQLMTNNSTIRLADGSHLTHWMHRFDNFHVLCSMDGTRKTE